MARNQSEHLEDAERAKRAGLSRRAFIAGAASTTMAAGIASMLGGCAPQSSEEGVDGATADASDLAPTPYGATYPWPAEPPQISDGDIEEELNVDVAVVGLGVSGVAAFRAASEAGASVAGFEKGSEPGVRSSQYAYLNGSLTERFNLGTFDLEEVIDHEWAECSSITNYAIVRKWAYHCAEAFDWWCAGDDELYIPEPGETISMMGDPDHPVAVMSMSDVTIDYKNENQAAYPENLAFTDHPHVVNANLQKGVDLGNTAYFGHFAEQLIMKDGRCTGVYVRNAETGKYKKVNATGGVILSCGDCGSNPEIMAHFFPHVVENGNGNPWPNMDVEGNRTNTGDAYKMGYWAGAAFSQYQAPMIHVMGGPGDTDAQDASMGLTAPLLRLNYHGERFQNEDVAATECEYAFEKQPQKKAFLVFDSHLDEQIPLFINTFASTLSEFDERVGDGTIFKGETLEELFSSIEGMDAEEAVKSVERYNELCANGVDEDFGKKAKYLLPVQDGPFYAQRMGLGLCLCTMGGLSSDEEAHVISTERDIIPGLYVSGNAQGDRFAVKYPFKLSGTSHSMAMYYGKVAGENAAAGK
ncbi:FAD-binding protein [Rubneribacter badeniensis]|uniref:FAD-binding protein n=1 Tax=Rubneribacter badeniensis TaxID=2070688 RepID=UPI003A8E381B